MIQTETRLRVADNSGAKDEWDFLKKSREICVCQKKVVILHAKYVRMHNNSAHMHGK